MFSLLYNSLSSIVRHLVSVSLALFLAAAMLIKCPLRTAL